MRFTRVFVLLLCVWWLLLSGVSLCFASTNVTRESRLLHDTLTIPLLRISKQTDEAWVVASVVPSTTSGHIQGAHGVPGERRWIRVPNASVFRSLEGVFRIKEHLTAKSAFASQIPYRLIQGVDYDGITVSYTSQANDEYIPLAGEGCVVAELVTPFDATPLGAVPLDAGAKDQRKPYTSPLFLIPSEWSQFVAPAIVFLRENPSLVPGQWKQTVDIKQTVATLSRTGNPWLQIEATKMLLFFGNPSLKDFQTTLSESEERMKVTLTYLMLTAAPETQLPDVGVAISNEIHSAPNAEQLENLTLAVFAARFEQQRQSRIRNAQAALLFQEIKKQQSVLHTQTKADEELKTLLAFVDASMASSVR